MKTRMFISILILVFALLTISESYATDKKDFKKDYRFIAGTWINEEYNSHAHIGKFVIRRDGSYDAYFKTTDTEIAEKCHYIIVDKWTDSQGNIWYKTNEWFGVVVEGKPSQYSLSRFSNSGKVWEYIGLPGGFPTELDENNFHYHIYYRQ